MRKIRNFRSILKGQALTEMLITIPLLFLMAAGMVQFMLFFMAKTTFEHACGQAARNFAGGNLEPEAFPGQIWKNLAEDQRFFNHSSLLVTQASTQTIAANIFLNQTGILGSFITKIKDYFLNYNGYKWIVSIRYNSLPLFGVVFPNGITVKTELAVLKYPSKD